MVKSDCISRDWIRQKTSQRMKLATMQFMNLYLAASEIPLRPWFVIYIHLLWNTIQSLSIVYERHWCLPTNTNNWIWNRRCHSHITKMIQILNFSLWIICKKYDKYAVISCQFWSINIYWFSQLLSIRETNSVDNSRAWPTLTASLSYIRLAATRVETAFAWIGHFISIRCGLPFQ